MESFYWENLRKTLNESAATTEAICQMSHTKGESTLSTSPEHLFYFPYQKTLKKPLGQGWVETKLLELKHLLNKKNSPNEKRPKTEGL